MAKCALNKEKKKRKHIAAKVILGVFLALVAAAAIFLYSVIRKAPDVHTLDATPKGYRSSVLDSDGNLVLALSGEESNRVYVDLKEIPKDLQNAFVAIEDERFYQHHGIDFRGILRALYRGLRTRNFSEGASTITQQLLKNNVFTDWMSEDTFLDSLERKIQEQYLAVRLEMLYNKDWILENYLNTINLGGGNWGVETAARYYFNKDVSELTLSESACLAAITKNPTTYNPLKNPEENSSRRTNVLDKMLSLEMITQEEYDEALADDLYTRIREAHSPGVNQEIMTYFEDALIYEVLYDLVEETGCTEEEAWIRMYRGGLTIYSTEDSSLQAICEEEANREGLLPDEAELSLVVIDNETGAVRAMIGGRGNKEASLLYNRAISSVRQPGSTIKILGQYAAGIEDGLLTLGTTVDDAPHTWFDGSEVHNSDGVYRGMTTIRQAITVSDNIVAVKCLQELGVNRTFSSIEKFGISTLTDDDRVEALALGGTANGVTNLEMTAAYSSLARGGQYVEPFYYTKVIDREGKVVLSREPETHRAVREETASLLTLALEDVLTEGTGTDAYFEGVSLAGKSGTTTGARDAWFIGYSPYLTCGSWGGYDDNRTQENPAYVKTLWRNVMSRAHEGLTDRGFSAEAGMRRVDICTKCGKLAVEGLCDHNMEGDTTQLEYFLPGTEPTEECDCHVAVEICTESGDKAGRYCPEDSIETRVYLTAASAGTIDADYVIPSYYVHGTCSKHTYFWSSWFHHKDDPKEEDTDDGPGSSSGSGNDPDGSGSDDGDSSDSGWHWPWENWFGGGSDSSGDSDNADAYGNNGGSGSTGGTGSSGQDGGTDGWGNPGGSYGYDNPDGYGGSGGYDSSGGQEDSSPGFWDWLFGR